MIDVPSAIVVPRHSSLKLPLNVTLKILNRVAKQRKGAPPRLRPFKYRLMYLRSKRRLNPILFLCAPLRGMRFVSPFPKPPEILLIALVLTGFTIPERRVRWHTPKLGRHG